MARNSKQPDYILLAIVSALIFLGIIVLSSVSALVSQGKFGTTYYYLNHQILNGLIPGIILAFAAYRIKLDTIKKWSPALLLINLALLLMVFLPFFGMEFKGASRWLNLRIISFQPSEFLKITFIVYLAVWLANKTEKAYSAKKTKEFSETLIAFSAIFAIVSLLLILQPDVGTLGIIATTSVLMYFLANTPLWHTFLFVSLGVAMLFVLIKTATYRLNRLLVLLNSGSDPMGIGYQIKHALIAIGSGGLFGLGLGMSGQKFGFLPESISDSIFAIFAEETGFAGGLILISLFVLFLWRGFKIAKKSDDKFLQLAAMGITCWICLQAFINIGSMIKILPLTGVPLPFISYGGSAIVAELTGIGILLNISKNI